MGSNLIRIKLWEDQPGKDGKDERTNRWRWRQRRLGGALQWPRWDTRNRSLKPGILGPSTFLVRMVADGPWIQKKRPGYDRSCRRTAERRKTQELISDNREFKAEPGILRG